MNSAILHINSRKVANNELLIRALRSNFVIVDRPKIRSVSASLTNSLKK